MEKVALIFGASSGIGFCTSVLLANKGYRVYNCSRRVSHDKRIENLLCDTSKREDILDVLNLFMEKEKRLDALIYCSGTSMAAPFEYTKEEDYRYLFEVNFFGMVQAVQHALPMLIGSKGRIILVSSMAAVMPIPYDIFYSCSKACMNVFAMGLSTELGSSDVKVVSVMPGGTRTDFTEKRVVYGEKECGYYARAVGGAVSGRKEIEQEEGICPEKVAEVIVEAIEQDTPPLCVAAGAKNKLFNQGAKLMPKRLTLEIIKSKYNI